MSNSSVFVCQSCEAKFPKWQGQCSGCGAWNTLVEELTSLSRGKRRVSQADWREQTVSLPQVEALKGVKTRILTGIGELDRVLGGGLVPGAVILVGGEPGIGKSTLLTQVVLRMLKQQPDTSQPILYLAGEESPSQIALRINRISENEQSIFDEKSATTKARGRKSASPIKTEHLVFSTATNLETFVETVRQLRPQLVIVDSIQTLATAELSGSAGSAGQLREAADQITQVAKQLHIPVFLVGHVTKDGLIAGPKILEHIVDAVIEVSGERTGELRLVRAIKNRFGATDEVGVFQVNEAGLAEISNPSALFMEQSQQAVPGSVPICVVEGSRPLLLEVQALVVSTQLAMPRRVGRGIELSRIQVLAAILQKHCNLPLGTTDIFVSVAGGVTVREPALDLGLAVAMASSHLQRPVPEHTLFVGEVGLLGEVRRVSYLDRRLKEAKRLGYTKIVSAQTHRTVRQVLDEFLR